MGHGSAAADVSVTGQRIFVPAARASDGEAEAERRGSALAELLLVSLDAMPFAYLSSSSLFHLLIAVAV